MQVTHEKWNTVLNWIVTGELTSSSNDSVSTKSRDKTLRQGYDEER